MIRFWPLLLAILVGQAQGRYFGYLGCKFGAGLCQENEHCFDDGVFGRCLSDASIAPVYRHIMDDNLVQRLVEELEALVDDGYRWSDMYTQCVVGYALWIHKQGLEYDPSFCLTRGLQVQNEAMPPAGDVSDVIPPFLSSGDQLVQVHKLQPALEKRLSEFDFAVLPDSEPPIRPLLDSPSALTYEPSRPDPLADHSTLQDDASMAEAVDFLGLLDGTLTVDDLSDDELLRFSRLLRRVIKDRQDSDSSDEPNFSDQFSRDTELPDDLLAYLQRPSESDASQSSASFESGVKDGGDSSYRLAADVDDQRSSVEVGRSAQLDAVGSEPEIHHALKKEQTNAELLADSRAEAKRRVEMPKDAAANDVSGSDGDRASDGSATLAFVDGNYAYIRTDPNILENMGDGRRVILTLESIEQLPRGTFSVVSVDKQKGEVTFRVNDNPDSVNGSLAAVLALRSADEFENKTGLKLVSAGIGLEKKIELTSDGKVAPKFFLLAFVVCGLVVGLVLAGAAFYAVRRHLSARDKVKGLAKGGAENESSKDYQDLCRHRMQVQASEKPEAVASAAPPSVRDPPNSNSPHSSTSSWSEEPVVTNMDITTGHLILSYMEDHMKNRDRLDREWDALVAYETEPNSTVAALEPANLRKNRYTDVLPYDHSRVAITDGSNVSNADYINASSITDHDPRNPVYIAAQGPLPHTVADFWQMIWEQGCVVIVNLTKTSEEGAVMCHRYWPHEGSELYHIYEIHLVSEHIWCDDFLVRSFYLKNLQTAETRTVTQFHFLTWLDLGVPASTKALLDFRRKVNKSYKGKSCPIVVHCSDGVGRTGTYILIDMVLNRMNKGAKEIDIAASLEHLRDQRMGLVKTKEQFEFALSAVAEEVHSILKALHQ